jgi:hypothetical protein
VHVSAIAPPAAISNTAELETVALDVVADASWLVTIFLFFSSPRSAAISASRASSSAA